MGDVFFLLMENWTKYNKYSLRWDIPTPRFPLQEEETSLFWRPFTEIHWICAHDGRVPQPLAKDHGVARGAHPEKEWQVTGGSISRGTKVRIQGVSNKNDGILWNTLLGTSISHQKSLLKMIILFPRWDMLVPRRVFPPNNRLQCRLNRGFCKKIPPCQGGKHQQFGDIFSCISNFQSHQQQKQHSVNQNCNFSPFESNRNRSPKLEKNPMKTRIIPCLPLLSLLFRGGDITSHHVTSLTLTHMAHGIGQLSEFHSTKIPTLQEINISHLGKFGTPSSKWTFQGDMLVPRRVYLYNYKAFFIRGYMGVSKNR